MLALMEAEYREQEEKAEWERLMEEAQYESQRQEQEKDNDAANPEDAPNLKDDGPHN